MRGSRSLVNVPKVEVPKVVLRPDPPADRLGSGIPARTLLLRLKASARNSKFCLSVILNSLPAATSIWKNIGPGTLSLPMGLKVPGATNFEENARGLIQQVGLGFAHR